MAKFINNTVTAGKKVLNALAELGKGASYAIHR